MYLTRYNLSETCSAKIQKETKKEHDMLILPHCPSGQFDVYSLLLPIWKQQILVATSDYMQRYDKCTSIKSENRKNNSLS